MYTFAQEIPADCGDTTREINSSSARQNSLGLRIAIVLLLVLSAGFSFKRYYFFYIDGDLPAIALPADTFDTLFSDPFGISAVFHGAVYESPNRYFAHWLISAYFRNVPLILQSIVPPIKSVYLAIATAQILIQLFLVYILAVYICGRRKPWDTEVLIAAAMTMPLFQTFGFYPVMGIIDHSVTYTFCYALALGLVMLFFLPYFEVLVLRRPLRFSLALTFGLIGLLIVISFNGPMNPAVIALVCALTLLGAFVGNFKANAGSLSGGALAGIKRIILSPLCLLPLALFLALYSLYLGQFNTANSWTVVPISERYTRLVAGLYSQLTAAWGWTLLWALTLTNVFIIKYRPSTEQGRLLLKTFGWFSVFATLYILALPLGGYRAYRPEILRYDTVMPVTLGLIVMLGLSTRHLLRCAEFRYRRSYMVVLMVFLGIFVRADAKIEKLNTCEWSALDHLARSTDRVVLLDFECSVLAWGKVLRPEDSQIKTLMLRRWNIIQSEKLYYQK